MTTERMQNAICLLLAIAAVLAAGSLHAATWLVNKDTGNDVDAAADNSGVTAFATIQAAIDKASANDTIRVDPGVYDSGVYTDSNNGRSRVYVSKKLTIESTGDRSNTVIEGYSDPESEHHGMTDGKSVRCVCVASAANGTILKGFTLRNGATQWNGGNETPKEKSCGGGFYDLSLTSSTSFLVDCAIENCSGTRGGGMRYGNAVRTYFRNNYASGNCAAAREACTYFCDFSGHTGPNPMLGWARAVVHCSLGNNNVLLINNSNITVKNSLMIPTVSGTSDAKCNWSGCVTTATSMQGTVQDTLLNVFGAGTVAPMANDFRLVAGGPAVGHGVVANLSDVPAAYRDKDIDGNPIPTAAGALSPGAHQLPVAPQGGKMVFVRAADTTMSVDGVAITSSNYLYAVAWPEQHFLQVASSVSGEDIMRVNVKVNGSSDAYNRPALTADNSIWLTVPPAGSTCEYGVEKASVKWVDANSTAETEDGSEAAPYKTIQAAVNSGSALVIKVKKGVYNSGGGVLAGHNNRVAILSGKYMRFIGVDGAEETFIVGASDPDASAEWRGCGQSAVRCVASESNGLMQGFTLTGGHSSSGESLATDNAGVRGGALYAISSNLGSAGFVLADCIVSNNAALRAGISYDGRLVRCLVTSNQTIGADGAVIYSIAANSVFVDNPVGVGSDSTGGGTIGRSARAYNCTVVEHDAAKGTPYGAADIYNSVFQAKRNNSVAANAAKGVIVWGFGSTGAGRIRTDPFFVDEASGDYHVLSTSPACGYGDSEDVADWWKYASMDFEGKPYAFLSGGRVIAGAYQTVEQVLSDLYVDVVNGSDSNAGDAPSAAKQTLASVLSVAPPGSTVHVAPGTYASGDMLQATPVKSGCTPTLRARAVVPAYVTLVADGAAADTVIDGADSIRCAFLESNATLRGFTVTRGATGTDSSVEDDNNHGAGVLARDYTATIEDCAITLCSSPRAAGGRYGTYRRCRFLGNTVTVNGSASRDGYYYGCYFNGNVGTYVLNYFQEVSGCTFGPDNVSSVGGDCMSIGATNGSRPVSCSMFCGGEIKSAMVLTNCAYLASMTVGSSVTCSPDCVAAQKLDIDANGAPVVGANDAVDAGVESLWTLGDTDASGNPRVTNGRMDIGCYEADWRSRYSADLLSRGQLTVTNATRNVRESGSEIFLPDGRLDATLAGVSDPLSIPIRVTGNGTLTVTVDGESLNYVGPLPAFRLDREFDDGAHGITFAYAPGENDDGGAYLGRFVRNTGMMVIVL